MEIIFSLEIVEENVLITIFGCKTLALPVLLLPQKLCIKEMKK